MKAAKLSSARNWVTNYNLEIRHKLISVRPLSGLCLQVFTHQPD
jgi:hypothetical protein